MDSKWIEHWIMDLISRKTIDTNTFDEWMWCPERYTEDDLELMKHFWNLRERCYGE